MSPSPASVSLRGIRKSFGETTALDGVDLEIGAGEFTTLVGPSGCGKSTLLRVIAGLEPQDAGSVEIAGRAVDRLRPGERDIAMVFQNYALYPQMTAGANIATPLIMRRLSYLERLPLVGLLSPRRPGVMRAIREEVREVAAQLRVDHLLHRKPSQLSGGQRQRVALGRAMVRRPRLFLMDEPLSNLDAELRVHMRAELTELHRRLGATFIYVTHDQVEAMTMSDRVAMMDGGRVRQFGTPAELYDAPVDLTVARFIGSPSINVIDAQTDASGLLAIEGVSLGVEMSARSQSGLRVGIRPEHLQPVAAPIPGLTALPAALHRSENHGADWIVHFDLKLVASYRMAARMTAERYAVARAAGALTESCWLSFDPSRAHLFSEDGRRVLPVASNQARREAAE